MAYNPYIFNPYAPPITPNVTPNIMWVSSEAEAAMYPVAPNNAVDLWDRSGTVVYRKQADAAGKPSMRVYDLVERVEAVPQETTVSYATKEDFDSVLVAIESIKAELESMKGDLYGIAGKKKSKKEVSDDE